MSLRGLVRDQVFLLPPRIDDWLPDDHAARFVAMFVDNLRPEEWMLLADQEVTGEVNTRTQWDTSGLNGAWSIQLQAWDEAGNLRRAYSIVTIEN